MCEWLHHLLLPGMCFLCPPFLSFFPAPSGFGFSARKRDRQTDRHEKGLAKNSWIPSLRIFYSHFTGASWTVSSPGENSCIGVIIVVFSDRTIDGLLAFAGAAFGNRASFVNITQFLGKIFLGFFLRAIHDRMWGRISQLWTDSRVSSSVCLTSFWQPCTLLLKTNGF
jgi:hypothetical protein